MCAQRFERRSKCISMLSAVVMKHHDQKHSEERVYLAFGFRETQALHGREGWKLVISVRADIGS